MTTRTSGMAAFALAALVGIGTVVAPIAGAAEDFAPVDRAGPPLSVDQERMDSALACSGDIAGADATPVLLLPPGPVSHRNGTAWTYQRAFRDQQRPFCALDLNIGPGGTIPANQDALDYQLLGEYVVNAIRTMHELRGGEISVIAPTNFAPPARWALRFWPDTRAMVDDFIQTAPNNHGDSQNDLICGVINPLLVLKPGHCTSGLSQLKESSRFLAALNSRQETFPGISYSQIATRFDELLGTPALGGLETGYLDPAGADPGQVTNVALQDVCPLDVSEHLLTITASNTAYALVMDALTHPGPADPARIDRSVCANPLMPYTDPLTLPTDLAAYTADTAASLGRAFLFTARPGEPPLKCYTLAAGCPGS